MHCKRVLHRTGQIMLVTVGDLQRKSDKTLRIKTHSYRM